MADMAPGGTNQIMISFRFTPSVRGVGSGQMSYEALYTASPTWPYARNALRGFL